MGPNVDANGPARPAGDPAKGLAPFEVSLEVVVSHPAAEVIDADDLTRLVRRTLVAEGRGGPWEMTIAIVDDAYLAALHDRFLGDPSVTDIMTFPFGPVDDGRADVPGPPDPSPSGGDLVISWDRAAAQAAERGATPEDEVAFLVVHGVLHLCDWDDGSDDARTAMLGRGRAILDAAHET